MAEPALGKTFKISDRSIDESILAFEGILDFLPLGNGQIHPTHNTKNQNEIIHKDSCDRIGDLVRNGQCRESREDLHPCRTIQHEHIQTRG